MILELINLLPSEEIEDAALKPFSKPTVIPPVKDKTIGYSYRFGNDWHKPEYNFDELQVAQDVDSFLSRTIKQKSDRFLLAGYEFISHNKKALDYIKYRFNFHEFATNRPWALVQQQIFTDLVRFGNALLVKARSDRTSPGNARPNPDAPNYVLQPVAGYFIAPFERIELVSNKNGTIRRYRQIMADGSSREFHPKDVVHFRANHKPGFSVGTPEFFSALDDIRLLRRLEENVTELIETNLFPRFHFKIGTKELPAMFTRQGESEVDYVKRQIRKMPPGSIYVSDYRQDIEVIGSENQALRIDYYLEYFRQRVFSAIGTSTVDMGIGSSSNRSTASTLSKQTMLSVEAVQEIMAIHINFYILNELLLEGGFNPLDPEEKVKIKFGIIDKAEHMAYENNVAQLFAQGLINHVEARQRLGLPPADDEWYDTTHYKLFAEPTALIKGTATQGGASEVLKGLPQSSVTPAVQTKEQQVAKAQRESKTNGALANKTRPANQHGKSSPRLTKDCTFILDEKVFEITFEFDFETNDNIIDIWKQKVVHSYELLKDYNIDFEIFAQNQIHRLKKLSEVSHV